MTPAPHPKAGFGLFPTPASPTAPWQLLLIGAQGSGKQSLAKQLAQIIPRTDQLVIHTTSELPISQSPSVQPKPPLHVDYAVLVVNLTDSQALANLETYMDLAPPEYFIGRLCIVATFFDRKMEHAFDLVELEAVIENICDIPIFYLNAKDPIDCGQVCGLLLERIRIATGALRPVTPSVMKTPDTNQIPVTTIDD